MQCRSDSGRSRFPVLLDGGPRDPAIFRAVSDAVPEFVGYGVGQELMARYAGHPLFDMAAPSTDDTFVTVYLRSPDAELEAELRRRWTHSQVRIEIVGERGGWYAYLPPD